MFIKHNLMALNAGRQFVITDKKKAKTTEKLSSGYRVNRAADDAAGLAISEKMRRQVKGLNQASRNCEDGISMVQIADGALNEIHDMLHRCSQLSIQASNDTLSNEDRRNIDQEVRALVDEIDRIAERTTFNTIPVLHGKAEGYSYGGTGTARVTGGLPDFIVNASTPLLAGHLDDSFTDGLGTHASGIIDFSGVNSGNLDQLKDQGFTMSCATCDRYYSVRFVSGSPSSTSASGDHKLFNVNIDGVTDGSELVNRILNTTGGTPGDHYTDLRDLGAGKLRVNDNRNNAANLETYKNNSVTLPGVAIAESELPEFQGLGELNIQAGAESGQFISIKLPAISSEILGINNSHVLTEPIAQQSIESFKNALAYVSEERSRMGAYQNRLEHTIKNLDNVVENTTAAESRIRDTDMAKEMVDYSASNILTQAGTAMMTQANQLNQNVLTLLG